MDEYMRNIFAGQALVGLIVATAERTASAGLPSDVWDEVLVRRAWAIAEQMMKAREGRT